MATGDPHYEIQAHLEPGERLLWAGAPKQGVAWRRSDAIVLPFTVVWLGAAVVWVVTLFGVPPLYLIPLFGLPWLVALVFMWGGRFIYDPASRARTWYGVTDRRIVIAKKLFKDSTETVPLDAIPRITLRRHQDGRGTLVFGPKSWILDDYPINTSKEPSPRFVLIEDPDHVQSLITGATRR